MPPRSKAQGESKQGLIITLVFFILATIGLGVGTYIGIADQEKLEKAAKDAKNSEDTFKADRDWYKFQAMSLYSYAGLSEGMEGVDTLGTLKQQFDGGSMKGGKDKDFATKALKSLEGKLGWEGNQPKETLAGAIAKLNTEKANLAKRNQELETNLKKAQNTINAKDEELQSARKDYETKLAELKKTLENDFTASNKQLEDFRSEVENLKTLRKKEKEDWDKEQRKLNGQIAKGKSEIKHVQAKYKDLEDRIAAFEAKSDTAPPNMRTDWKIVRMDVSGKNPYINLGSEDHVKPQLTFTIHGVGVDGRPSLQSKGTLEVVNVNGPHLSQTRVTSVKDRNRDPILEGDVIYNASWNPHLKKHVAIAGIIDLTSDGRDSLYEFIRNLERQNMVVDAYLDPKDGSMKGKITFQTQYLILGDTPHSPGGGKKGEAQQQVEAGRTAMQNEAKKYGVKVTNLIAYLEMIGYRLPHSVQAEKPSLYNPDLRPDLAPRLGGDRPPPPRPAAERPPGPPSVKPTDK